MEHRDQIWEIKGTQGSNTGDIWNTGMRYRGYREHRDQIQGI